MIAALWLMSGAEAGPIVVQRVRVGHAVAFVDADVGGGEDFFVTNGNYAARNAIVTLYEEPLHVAVDGGLTDDDGYIVFSSLDKAKQYTLELWAKHDVNHDGERVLSVLDGAGLMEMALSEPFFPTGTSSFNVTTTIGQVFDASDAGNEWINAAAAASWSMFRRPGAFPRESDSGAVYRIIMAHPSTSNCAGTLAAGYCPTDQAVFLDPLDTYAWARKYIIVHEFAHELQHWALVPSPGQEPEDWIVPLDYDATSTVTGCKDHDEHHSYVSYEYQSAAIVEGMAHYITAVAFNDTTDTDCRFDPGGPYEWYLNGPDYDDQFSCEGYDPASGHPLGADAGGAEYANYPNVPAGAYFYFDTDGASYYGACSDNPVTTNRAIEFDWLRFLWDVDTKEGLNMADVVDAWFDANPAGGTLVDPWNEGDLGAAADMPLFRMHRSFVTLNGYLTQTEWDTLAGNPLANPPILGNGVNQ
jgi:hypothetical protein